MCLDLIRDWAGNINLKALMEVIFELLGRELLTKDL